MPATAFPGLGLKAYTTTPAQYWKKLKFVMVEYNAIVYSIVVLVIVQYNMQRNLVDHWRSPNFVWHNSFWKIIIIYNSFLKRIFILSTCMCVYMHDYVLVSTLPLGTTWGCWVPLELGVTGSCEPPELDARNWTWSSAKGHIATILGSR